MLEDLGVPCSSGIAMFIIVLVLSFFMLAFGMFFPKRIATLHSERIALAAARPVRAFSVD